MVVFLAILSVAMLAGLLTTLLAVMRIIWNEQTDDTAATSFHEFLDRASTNPVLATLCVIPVVCTVALIFLGAPSTTQLTYAMTGGGIFFVGFLLWTVVLNLPVYRIVAAWEPHAPHPDVRKIIRRFHVYNLVRLGSSLAAGVLFFLAV